MSRKTLSWRRRIRSRGCLPSHILPTSFHEQQQGVILHPRRLRGRRGGHDISYPVALEVSFRLASDRNSSHALERHSNATLALLCTQALFLQTDLPLHVALTKHKACRTASSNVSVAIGPNSTPPQGHPGLGREEDVGFQIMDTDEQPVPGATKKPGELVGTAEVDWR